MVDTRSSPEFPGPRVAAYIGKPGWGKTFRARERWFTWPRCIAIDTKNPDPSIPPDYPGIVVWTPQELAAQLRKRIDAERFRIVYRGQMSFPIDPMKPNGASTVEPIFAALTAVHDVLLTVDETDKWTSANYTPEGLYSFIHHGRTLGQAVTLCARRPTNLPRDLTSSVEEFWSWPLDEPLDIKYLLDRGFDESVYPTLPKFAAYVKRTPPGEPPTFHVVP
jgi:hypothetical protein